MNGSARLRERFLTTGEPPAGVRDEIAASWLRSSSWGLRSGAVEPSYLEGGSPRSRLIRAARPVLDAMSERLGDLGVSFILADSDGRIVDRESEGSSLGRRLDRFDMTVGHIFTEGLVGTNGIGTAIEARATVRVDGHEHFCDRYVDFTCVGVPIDDRVKRTLVGVLDVCTDVGSRSPMLELIAEQAVRDIEFRIMEQHSLAERALLNEFLSINARTRSGVVVVGDRILMANPQASRMFQELDHPLIWDHASKAGVSGEPVEGYLTLSDGDLLGTRTTAILDGGTAIGSVLEMRVISDSSTSSMARRRIAPCHVPGMAGRDRTLVRAFVDARAAVDQRAVIVCGEAGVGKLSLAKSLAPGNTVVRDCAEVGIDGDYEWISEIDACVDDRVDGLIVTHVDLLHRDTVQRLLPVLVHARAAGIPTILTYTCGIWSNQSAMPQLDASRVWLPPLRNRLNDIPQLVEALSDGRRFAPEVVQLLCRLSWPDNVTELKSLITQMTTRCPSGTVQLADVPVAVRRAAPRRPLSRFEHAEMHALLDAMAETRGNKQKAARLLGISRSTLYRKLQSTGVDLDNTVY